MEQYKMKLEMNTQMKKKLLAVAVLGVVTVGAIIVSSGNNESNNEEVGIIITGSGSQATAKPEPVVAPTPAVTPIPIAEPVAEPVVEPVSIFEPVKTDEPAYTGNPLFKKQVSKVVYEDDIRLSAWKELSEALTSNSLSDLKSQGFEPVTIKAETWLNSDKFKSPFDFPNGLYVVNKDGSHIFSNGEEWLGMLEVDSNVALEIHTKGVKNGTENLLKKESGNANVLITNETPFSFAQAIITSEAVKGVNTVLSLAEFYQIEKASEPVIIVSRDIGKKRTMLNIKVEHTILDKDFKVVANTVANVADLDNKSRGIDKQDVVKPFNLFFSNVQYFELESIQNANESLSRKTPEQIKAILNIQD